MKLRKVDFGIGLVLSTINGAYANPLGPDCTKYSSGTIYYPDINTIKIPMIDLAGDGSGPFYCAILRDLDHDGRYELDSMGLVETTWRPGFVEAPVFDESSGTVEISEYQAMNFLSSGGYFSGSVTLQQEPDGQFSLKNLVKRY